MKQLIPVTIVTGFLGSGKTTLLGSLIASKQTQGRPSRRLALLINEFGEVAIDGVLMRDSAEKNINEHDQIQIHDFPHGLIAYGDDEFFIPTMRAIAARRANVDHVLIETSGLALPTAIMEILQGPELAIDFILDATLAVVDTPLLLSDQFERCSTTDDAQAMAASSVASLFDQQLEYADVVVLNKIDLLDENALLLAEARVRQRAPKVRFLELAYHAQLDIRLALGLRLHQPTQATHEHRYTQLASMPDLSDSPLKIQYRLNGHAHSGLAGHSHGLATHKHFHEQDPGWLSFVLRSDTPQHVEQLQAALVDAARAEPILRTKGFVCTADAQQKVLVQGVRSRIAISTECEPDSTKRDSTKRDPTKKSELVFIGYHLSRANVATLLSNLTGTTWS